jgi:hypothetical protein
MPGMRRCGDLAAQLVPGERRATVAGHKYTVGETVQYTAGAYSRTRTSGSFLVVKLLPSEGDENLYRIKSEGEPYERVAKESQLDRPQ